MNFKTFFFSVLCFFLGDGGTYTSNTIVSEANGPIDFNSGFFDFLFHYVPTDALKSNLFL